MFPHNFIRHLQRAMLLLLGLLTTVHAQTDPVALAQLDSPKTFVGGIVRLKVEVLNVGNEFIDGTPTLNVDGLNIAGPYSSSSITINGFTRLAAPITYEISPTKTGTYIIPAIQLTVAGKSLSTQPLQLIVVEATPENSVVPLAQLKTAKTELWEGEESTVQINFLVPRHCQMQELPFPSLARSGFASKRFNRSSQNGLREIDGQFFEEFSFQTTFYGIKSGQITLGPAEFKGDLYVPQGGISPLGMRNMKKSPFAIKSNPVEMTIKALPTAGRPDNFSGAIGKFDLSVQLQQDRVQVGDPLTAIVVIHGQGNYETLQAPVLESTDGWRSYEPRVVKENRNGDDRGALFYSQIVEPQSAAIRELPRFVLSYFDPNTGTYGTARSENIPIIVSPGKNGQLTANAENANAGVRDFGNTAMPLPNEVLGGLLGLMPTEGATKALNTQSTPVFARVNSTPWLLHGLPALLLTSVLGAAGIRRWRAHAATQQQAKHTAQPKEILAELRKLANTTETTPQAFYTRAVNFTEAWTREHKVKTKATDKTEPEAEQLLERIRLRRDFHCFGGTATTDRLDQAEAREILTALEKL